MMTLNWQPSRTQLRVFACGALVALPLAAWIVRYGSQGAWTMTDTIVVGGAAAVGGLLVVLAWLVPGAVRPIYVAASVAVWPIAIVIGEALLLLLYYGIFSPLGLLFRLTGRDALQRKFTRGSGSYWEEKTTTRDPASYFWQS